MHPSFISEVVRNELERKHLQRQNSPRIRNLFYFYLIFNTFFFFFSICLLHRLHKKKQNLYFRKKKLMKFFHKNIYLFETPFVLTIRHLKELKGFLSSHFNTSFLTVVLLTSIFKIWEFENLKTSPSLLIWCLKKRKRSRSRSRKVLTVTFRFLEWDTLTVSIKFDTKHASKYVNNIFR